MLVILAQCLCSFILIMVQVFTESFVSMIANILAIIFSLKLSSKAHPNAPIFTKLSFFRVSVKSFIHLFVLFLTRRATVQGM